MPTTTPSFTFTTVDAPGATETTPQAINDRGEVVGAYEPSLGVSLGFVYDNNCRKRR
jgi:hypothetical protein